MLTACKTRGCLHSGHSEWMGVTIHQLVGPGNIGLPQGHTINLIGRSARLDIHSMLQWSDSTMALSVHNTDSSFDTAASGESGNDMNTTFHAVFLSPGNSGLLSRRSQKII